VDTDRSSVAPFRIASFRRLWIASLFFNLGHLVQVVASSWVILELTGSPFWVSLMVGAPLLPLLFLSLPAGAAADLLDRRRVIIGASTIMVLAAGGMAFVWVAGLVTPGRLVALGLLLGTGVALFNPAWQAIMPRLVPVELLPGAVALNSASGGVATAVGPALGGVLVAIVDPGWTFGLATFGYSAILLSVLRTKTSEWTHEVGSMGIAIATGLRYLRFSHGYRWLLLLGCLFGFSSSALRTMLPNVTSDVLLGGSALYGGLLGAFGAGALVGGLTRSQGSDLLGDRMMPLAILAFGAAGAVVGASRLTAVTAAAVFVAGIMWTWILSTLNSTFQVLTPDWVRGRTMSAFVLSVFGFMPIGSILSGALGELVGAAGSLLVFSVGVVVLAVISLKMPLPVLEYIAPPVVPEPEFGDGHGGPVAPAPVMVVTTWTIEEEHFEPFLELLADLRRLRLSTGAYHWAAYRSARDLRRISEVFMLHSWEQHLQQHRRLDTRALDTIRRAEGFGASETSVKEHLIAFDVDHPKRRPEWQSLLSDHERMHRDRPAPVRAPGGSGTVEGSPAGGGL
jgi:MFS family permease